MKFKKISVALSILSISMFSFVACTKENKQEVAINNFTRLLNEKKYDELYDSLPKESKEYINSEYESKEGFIKKYSAVYSGVGVSNVKIEIKESKDKKEIPVTISMDTVAGNLKFDDAKVKLVEEDKEAKILWDESLILPPMTQDDSVRVKTSNGSRGRILDRDGNPLAYNGEVNYINISPTEFSENKNENISEMASILDISEETIENKLNQNASSDQAINIVKVSNYEEKKVNRVKEIPGVMVQKGISRVYAKGEAFGSLLGYIGSITAEELEKNPGKGYTSTSLIGKNGLEQAYEDKLRSKDGVHIYINRNNEEVTIAQTEVRDGEDITISIDTKLQEEVYAQMDKQKGASIAMDPKSGEILAMVSSPSYDSNTLVTYKTKEIAKRWEESKNAEFDNRANNLYSPGSTMKLITAAVGLENQVIDPTEKMDIKGNSWQNSSSWGDYAVTRVKDAGAVNLYEAIKYSDNIYFADKSIKIGSEKLIEGAKQFGIGEELNFEYPMPKSQIANDSKLEDEVLLADTGYGQGQVLTTPLNVTMAYSALGNEGKIMMPRLVISENSEPKVYSEPISKDNLEVLHKGFSGVINDADGSGSLCKIDGVNLAGKTGTAEIKASKDDKSGNENSWFAAVDIDNSKIAISMVMEDMKEKSTSEYLVPKVKNIIQSYLSKEHIKTCIKINNLF
ncbi:MAG: penicillin-binding transpeptidase domain-containing protein [Peptostreptococcaceae bacterium]